MLLRRPGLHHALPAAVAGRRDRGDHLDPGSTAIQRGHDLPPVRRVRPRPLSRRPLRR